MPKPFISARVPETIDTAITERIARTGESRTDILLNALKAYLEGDIKTPRSIDERLSALEKEFALIKQKLKEPVQTSFLDNSNDDTFDNKISDKEIAIENKVDNTIDNDKLVKPDNSFDNTLENGREHWTTKEVEAVGISRKTIEYRFKNEKLPYEKNGVTVHNRVGKENRSGRVTSIWEISKQN